MICKIPSRTHILLFLCEKNKEKWKEGEINMKNIFFVHDTTVVLYLQDCVGPNICFFYCSLDLEKIVPLVDIIACL